MMAQRAASLTWCLNADNWMRPTLRQIKTSVRLREEQSRRRTHCQSGDSRAMNNHCLTEGS